MLKEVLCKLHTVAIHSNVHTGLGKNICSNQEKTSLNMFFKQAEELFDYYFYYICVIEDG